MPGEDELSVEEQGKIKDDVIKSVFENKKMPSAEDYGSPENEETAEDEIKDEDKGEKTDEDVKEDDDPWRGTPDHIRTEFESLRNDVKAAESLSYRLKQAESRIGSLDKKNKELETALADSRKAADDLQKSQRTAEEQEETAKAEAEWNAFKEVEPDTADAVERRIKHHTRGTPDAEALVKELKESIREELKAEIPKNDGMVSKEDMISLFHPGWTEDVNTDEFGQFIKAHPEHMAACQSYDVKATIGVLDAFKEFKKPKKTAAEIAAEQDERLKQAALDNSGKKASNTKNVDDMSEKEIRTMVRKKTWDEWEP